nr:hypothetical protein CcurKRNrm1_p025 [Cryptomonas curvata]
MFGIKSDNLPKRSSCQIISFNFKNFKAITNLMFKSKNKLEERSLNNLCSIFFSISLFNINHYKKKARISLAFLPKILKKKILLIIRHSKAKKKKNYFNIKKIKSVGLIITKKLFLKKYDQFYFQKQISNCFSFLCIEEPLSSYDNSLILNLIKKLNISVCSLRFKQNFIKGIIASCVSLWINLPAGSSFQILLYEFLCIKKLFNNILQTVGGIIDILPGGHKHIIEIGIKNNSLFLYL